MARDKIREDYNRRLQNEPVCTCCGMRHGPSTNRDGCCSWCTRHGRRR